MDYPTYLHIGGLVAMGFDGSGRYLLTVSHSGRGLFDTQTWKRVARQEGSIYPDDGRAQAIGPIAGVNVPVQELDYSTETLVMFTPGGDLRLSYEDGVVTVSSVS